MRRGGAPSGPFSFGASVRVDNRRASAEEGTDVGPDGCAGPRDATRGDAGSRGGTGGREEGAAGAEIRRGTVNASYGHAPDTTVCRLTLARFRPLTPPESRGAVTPRPGATFRRGPALPRLSYRKITSGLVFHTILPLQGTRLFLGSRSLTAGGARGVTKSLAPETRRQTSCLPASLHAPKTRGEKHETPSPAVPLPPTRPSSLPARLIRPGRPRDSASRPQPPDLRPSNNDVQIVKEGMSSPTPTIRHRPGGPTPRHLWAPPPSFSSSLPSLPPSVRSLGRLRETGGSYAEPV